MNAIYLQKLYKKRTELEAKLELHDARYCFGEEEVEDGTGVDLQTQIDEITQQINEIESYPLR